MKKIFRLIYIIVFMSFMVVNAAYAYVWTVNGESLRRGGDSILNGQAKWIESNDYSGGILILNNYNGGEIKLECKGTGMNQVFAIELKGNNTITADKIGLLTTDKVEFIGDGTLTITAPVPISSYEEIDVPNQMSVITIYGKKAVEEVATPEVKEEEKEEVVAKEDTKEDSADENVEPTKSINKYLYLVIIGVAVIGLFVLAGFVSNINKKRS